MPDSGTDHRPAPRFVFIIGGQRCGSTLLRRVLNTHPDIRFLEPERPEPRSFIGTTAPRSASEYLSRFGNIDVSVFGEKSTSYLDRPDSAAAIHDAIPDASIIAIVREPSARAVSHFRFSSSHGAENLPIEEALTSDAEVRPYDVTKYSVSPYSYLKRGRYAELLEPWLDEFGASRMRVVELERLGTDTTVIEGIHDFLGVDPLPVTRLEVVNSSQAPVPSLSPSLLQELRASYEPHNHRLAEMFGLDLTVWNG